MSQTPSQESPYASPRSDSPSAPTSHPIGFWFIFWGELAERASYYGMRAILPFYMADVLMFSKDHANEVMHYFIAACYFLTLAGGWVADKFLGKYWTIVAFCLPYILGHIVLGIETETAFFIALGLLALGSGVTKPNISPLMGLTYDQKRAGNERLRSEAFLMFYFAINVGAALAQFGIPYIRTSVQQGQWSAFAPDRAYQVAFFTPAILMAVAFAIFAGGKKFYAVEKIERRKKTPEERALQWTTLRRLGGLFLLITYFWCIFDQQASTFTFFARERLDLNLLGWQMDADQVQLLNPVFILLLTPVFFFLWRKVTLSAPSKMIIGLILTGACLAIFSFAAHLAESDASGKATVWWAVLAYFCLTAGELLVSPVGLELAFSGSPPRLKSFVTAIWLLMVAVGNLQASQLTQWYDTWGPHKYFLVCALIMIPVIAAFAVIARRFNQTQTPAAVVDIAE